MKKLLFCICFSCLIWTANSITILPQPLEIKTGEGYFEMDKKTSITVNTNQDRYFSVVKEFQRQLILVTGYRPFLIQSDKLTDNRIHFIQESSINNKEGYTLSITPERIIVKASQPEGFFYAIQTLYQMMPIEIGGGKRASDKIIWKLPSAEITDSPRFAYRGFMLDVARHFMPKQTVLKMIDVAAFYKLNTFHFHLSDDQGWRIEIKKYPRLTEIGSFRPRSIKGFNGGHYPQLYDNTSVKGYYTQEEIKEIVAYAAQKQITIIPEIDMPGHMTAALASYPNLGCPIDTTYEVEKRWGIFPTVLCPKESTITFINNVLEEVIALFPGTYIHIGGDECPKDSWKRCPNCRRLIDSLGLKDDTAPGLIDRKKHTKEEKLQSYFIGRIEKLLNRKGKEMIGWDEILEGGLSANATVMSWRGESGGIQAARQKHKVVMAPNTYLYFDYYQEEPNGVQKASRGFLPLDKVYSYEPISGELQGYQEYIWGVQANLWTEFIPSADQLEYALFPRLLALSEIGWCSKENKSFDRFKRSLLAGFQQLDIRAINACRDFFAVHFHTTGGRKDTPFSVELSSFYPQAKIRYSTDGSTPSSTSPIYSQPIVIKGNTTVKAIVMDSDNRPVGKVESLEIVEHKAAGKNYKVNAEAENPESSTFLTDGKKGYIQERRPWSIHRKDPLEVVIDMENATTFSQISYMTLNAPYRFIWAIKEIEIMGSNNGTLWNKIYSERYEYEYANRWQLFSHHLSFAPQINRYIKLIFHPLTIPKGYPLEGEKGKIGIDELIIR